MLAYMGFFTEGSESEILFLIVFYFLTKLVHVKGHISVQFAKRNILRGQTSKEKIKILEPKTHFGPSEGPKVHPKLQIGISLARYNF